MRRIVVPTAVALFATFAIVPVTQADPGVSEEAGARPPPSGPRFIPTPCPKGAFPARLDVDCGYVRVPQDRSEPNGRKIRVAAAYVHSSSAQPAPEPLLVLPGGPSASSMTRFSIRAYLSGTSWDDGHDKVLVDTRGVGNSVPRLGCPELDRASKRDFHAGPYVGSRGVPIFSRALKDCRRRLTSSGIDVADYTVRESVADLETLRRALGVSRWNLMAVSADGILGMSYLREHPTRMRSVIVDSGMAPQMVAGIDYDRGLHRQLEKIFAGCAASRACRQAYPNVRRSFMRAVRRLNEHPQMVRIPDFRPQPIRLRVDGIWVYFDVSHNIFPGNAFAPQEIHRSLEFMWRIGHGQVAAVYRELFGTGPAEFFPEDRYLASGRTMSLECHDLVAFLTPGQLRRAARDFPWYAARYRDRHYDLAHTLINPRSPAGCRIWDVGKAAPRQHRPVVSDVPTLVLAGEYDGGVTPYTVRKNTVGLSNGTYVEFAGGHHLQLAFYSNSHRCARSMAAAFLADPMATVDRTCADEMPAFDFTPPAEGSEERARVPRAFGPPRWLSWMTGWGV